MVIWIIGLSGSGKTTVGKAVYESLKEREPNTVFIDGDDIRRIFNDDKDASSYTIEGRRRNADRISQLCLWLDKQGINVVCAILSIFDSSRAWNRKNYSKYFEVYIDVNKDTLFKRDPKGLYKAAREGREKNVVGMDISFVPPAAPHYTLDNNGSYPDLEKVASDILGKALK